MSLEQLPLDWHEFEPRVNATAPSEWKVAWQRACWRCLRLLLEQGSATAAELKRPEVGKDRYSARLCDMRRDIRKACGLSEWDLDADPFPKEQPEDKRNPTFRLAPWARTAARHLIERHDAQERA